MTLCRNCFVKSLKFTRTSFRKFCSAAKLNTSTQKYNRETDNTNSENEETEKFTDAEETEKFDKTNFDWWDIKGPMMALHTMNSVRVPFIRNCLLYQGIGTGKPHSSKPLTGIDILEVGCGAGILSESLCRLGASVTAIDAAENAIEAAKYHRGNDKDLQNLQYLNAHLEDITTIGSLRFDTVVASEVIEHVNDPDKFISYCSNVLKPGGSLFISTINRTTVSYLLAVLAAEKTFRVVDDGTHDWEKFVKPEEITKYLDNAGCSLTKIHGLLYNPIFNSWNFIEDTSMSYILHAIKLEPIEENVENETDLD